MRENIRGRRRAFAAGAVAGATCLLVGLTPGTGDAEERLPVLPVAPSGALGVLDTSTSTAPHKLVFDTSSGIYSLDGVKSDVNDRRKLKLGPAGESLWVFDFDRLGLGKSTQVAVRGEDALVLLSKGDASIATPLRLDGKPGADNGRGAGGGGG